MIPLMHCQHGICVGPKAMDKLFKVFSELSVCFWCLHRSDEQNDGLLLLP